MSLWTALSPILPSPGSPVDSVFTDPLSRNGSLYRQLSGRFGAAWDSNTAQSIKDTSFLNDFPDFLSVDPAADSFIPDKTTPVMVTVPATDHLSVGQIRTAGTGVEDSPVEYPFLDLNGNFDYNGLPIQRIDTHSIPLNWTEARTSTPLRRDAHFPPECPSVESFVSARSGHTVPPSDVSSPQRTAGNESSPVGSRHTLSSHQEIRLQAPWDYTPRHPLFEREELNGGLGTGSSHLGHLRSPVIDPTTVPPNVDTHADSPIVQPAPWGSPGWPSFVNPQRMEVGPAPPKADQSESPEHPARSWFGWLSLTGKTVDRLRSLLPGWPFWNKTTKTNTDDQHATFPFPVDHGVSDTVPNTTRQSIWRGPRRRRNESESDSHSGPIGFGEDRNDTRNLEKKITGMVSGLFSRHPEERVDRGSGSVVRYQGEGFPREYWNRTASTGGLVRSSGSWRWVDAIETGSDFAGLQQPGTRNAIGEFERSIRGSRDRFDDTVQRYSLLGRRSEGFANAAVSEWVPFAPLTGLAEDPNERQDKTSRWSQWKPTTLWDKATTACVPARRAVASTAHDLSTAVSGICRRAVAKTLGLGGTAKFRPNGFDHDKLVRIYGADVFPNTATAQWQSNPSGWEHDASEWVRDQQAGLKSYGTAHGKKGRWWGS